MFKSNAETSFTLSSAQTVYVRVKTWDGAYRFMIRPAGTSSDYVPYMMSNLELTQKEVARGKTEIAYCDSGNEVRFATEELLKYDFLLIVVRNLAYETFGSTMAAAPASVNGFKRINCIPNVATSGTIVTDSYKGWLIPSSTDNAVAVLGSGTSSRVVLFGIKL